jgi:hypothetical protein
VESLLVCTAAGLARDAAGNVLAAGWTVLFPAAFCFLLPFWCMLVVWLSGLQVSVLLVLLLIMLLPQLGLLWVPVGRLPTWQPHPIYGCILHPLRIIAIFLCYVHCTALPESSRLQYPCTNAPAARNAVCQLPIRLRLAANRFCTCTYETTTFNIDVLWTETLPA